MNRAACRWLLALTVLVIVGMPLRAPAEGAAYQPPAWYKESGLDYSLDVRSSPRPMRIHRLRLDLKNPRLEVVGAVADDPDGTGPADAALRDPVDLCKTYRAVALVDANAFGSFGAEGGQSHDWAEGMPVRILGLAASVGGVKRVAQSGYVSCWQATNGVFRLGMPPTNETFQVGVAGFGWIVHEGKVTQDHSSAVHPRTAVGTDPSGRVLWLVVVDGRQPGFSEGMTLSELGGYLNELGCCDAVNMDGGGSSVMILRDDAGRPALVNRPSNRMLGAVVTRPIPVGLAVRMRDTPDTER